MWRPVRFLFLLFLSFSSIAPALKAQNIIGTWQGRTYVFGTQIRIVFHIKQDSSKNFIANMDSPDQGSFGNVVDEIELTGDSLYMYIPEISGEFNGICKKDTSIITGYIKQNGLKIPLKLIKGDDEDLLYKRPQKPVKPYPYREEEVTIINKEGGDTLAGTFTKPNGAGKFPAAIMITGSGPEDRDETVLGHRPFLIISDYLTRKGFAVLRCDDRGTAKSTGVFRSATSADFASDVSAQIDFLKKRSDVDVKRMGLIGHSEGGIIAPLVAAKREDVAFLVLMAGPAMDLFDLLLLQDSLINLAEGKTQDEISKSFRTNKKLYEINAAAKDSAEAANAMDQYLYGIKTSDRVILSTIRQLCSPWMRWYIGYDPCLNLEKIKCPVLAINGEKDVQVPAEINIQRIEQSLKAGGNKNFEIKIFPGLNHLFQHCKKCSVSEYVDIEETMSPEVPEVIGNWLEKNFLK